MRRYLSLHSLKNKLHLQGLISHNQSFMIQEYGPSNKCSSFPPLGFRPLRKISGAYSELQTELSHVSYKSLFSQDMNST